MSCFSVTDPFLTTFYYVEKRNGILRKNRGSGLKDLTCPYMGVGGSKNCQNHPYLINEWPFITLPRFNQICSVYLFRRYLFYSKMELEDIEKGRE